MTNLQLTAVTLICSVMSIVANMIQGVSLADTLPGMGVLLLIIILAVSAYKGIDKLTGWHGLPIVAYATTIGCILTIPGFPGAEYMAAATGKISFLGLCTPILAYAGLSVGKDMDLLKRQGWRIVVTGLVVFVGTFVGSAFIAEMILRAMH